MGDSRLCFLLLLITCALAQQGSDSGDNQTPTCLLATRYKNFRKYVYQYNAESRNGVSGTANLKNGPKVTCKVELEVPQTCSFVLRTTECTLSEVSVIDSQGQPVYRPAAGSEDFRAAMEKNPLKFVVEQVTEVNLYPEQDEPANILNVKRGIISALMVPLVEEENNKFMPTVHGLCKTDFTANSRKETAADVTVTRDLSQCDQFNPMSDHTSPLALVSGMSRPLSKLIQSTQTCSYQFDSQKKHMTAASCMEKHIFLPFSHKATYGMTSEVLQTLTLQDSSKINNRISDYDESNRKPLHLDFVPDKSPIQTKDIMLTTLRDLSGLAQTDQGQQRAGLFQKLVTEMRGLKNETLGPAVSEMMAISTSLTMQALLQCGTVECTSAILQALQKMGTVGALGIDAAVYTMGLVQKPCGCRVRDMLSMAQHRQSKAIMYGLSNAVRKFFQTKGKVTPEIADVSQFMASLLAGDCSGDEDKTFLTLRVIGNMGAAMQAANPALQSTLLKCMTQPAASSSVQQAAVQAFRQMNVDQKISKALQETYEDTSGPVQRRIAAYLMLMKSPEKANLAQLISTLAAEPNEQVKSFVASHITNILSSEDAKSQRTREMIKQALGRNNVPSPMDFTKFSRNYKINPMMASMEGNVLFESTGYMPREVMLETTLNAFGYNLDILEVGIEGSGFEPTINALFGEKGFFPDAVSLAMYWVENKMPSRIQEVLQNWVAPLKNERVKKQVPRDIMKEVNRSFQKLVKQLRSQQSPEFMSYLRIMGNELGYIKSSEMKSMAQSAYMLAQTFFEAIPSEFFRALVTKTDNELFAHYIFMDNEFALPTAAGFPLKFTLSGIFAPGAKGGFKMVPGKKELSFMPSMGVEFVTQMGIHIPEFVTAGIKMHTSMFHESALNANLAISSNQVKLTIPAPQGTTQLFSVSNRLLSVSTTQTKMVPSMVEDRTDLVDCSTPFLGVKYCVTLRYSNASSTDAAPYYPLTGETRFALEVQPTEDVKEYTATISYDLLKEGKEGRHKVDVVKMVLKAEGSQPTEATATVKYNRHKNMLSTDIQIPDYDVEAGIKVSASDTTAKGKKMQAITLDVTNKNIPQFTLVGRTRVDAMKDAMAQFQLTVPALQTDATTTATLKHNGLMLQLETAVKLPETSSLQRVTFRFDKKKVEVEMKSDTSSEIKKLIPDTEVYQQHLQNIVDDILDQKVTKTDMKLRHIVSKTIEASNIWLDKMAVQFPYVENLRNMESFKDLTMPSLPEKLFLTYDGLLRYEYKDSVPIAIPLPFGGKSSKDLNIPPAVTFPEVDIPEIGLYIPKRMQPIPTFTIPHDYEIHVPLLGVAEASAKLSSNFYNWEGSISGGNNTVNVPSYIASYKVKADSPVNILSYNSEGTAMITGSFLEDLMYGVNCSFRHTLIDTSYSVIESVTYEEVSTLLKSNYKFEASSPIGLQTSLHFSFQGVENTADLDLTGEYNIKGNFRVGPVYANSVYAQSFRLNPNLEKIATGESTFKFESTYLQVDNTITGSFNYGDLLIVSDTNVQKNSLKHVAELSYKDGQLSLKSDAVSAALGPVLKNKAELIITYEAANIRVESQADEGKNRAYSLLSGSLNDRGMEINSDGSITFEATRGLHKGTVTISYDRLETSGTTTLQSKPLTFENNFNGKIDGAGAILSTTSKGSIRQHSAELVIEGKLGGDEAYLNSIYEGNLFDMSSRNRMNLKVNKQGLMFANNLMGSLKKMKTEHTHSLTLTLWTLAFHSKSDNFISDSTSYKHDIKVNMKPFVASVSMNNNLKLLNVELTNDGQVKLEPYKMDLTGNLRGAYGVDQEFRHSYEIGYAGLQGKVKCSTTGKYLGSQLSHNADLEVAGLSSKFNSETKINSESLKLENTLRTLVMPFSISVDALLNANGELITHGMHTGQMYSKLLLKAEPLTVAYSHDCRASSRHQLDRGAPVVTQLDTKVDGLLTPSEQSAAWKMKSSVNSYAYNQEISAYNNDERVGVELSGKVLEKAASGDQDKEYSISGFLKYDKNGNVHVIALPFIESFPEIFDQFKITILNALESLQQYINSEDISQLAEEFKASLDSIPKKLNDYITEMDLENKINVAKKKLIVLTEEYIITTEDLEASLENLRAAFERTLSELAYKIRDSVAIIKEHIERGTLTNAVRNSLMEIGHKLRTFDERHEISLTILNVIHAIEDIIRQLDLQQLKDSSIAWLQKLDAKYDIKAKILETVSKLKQSIMNFDIMTFVHKLKENIPDIEVNEYIHKLSAQIHTEEIARVLESMKDVIINWIEEYEIAEKVTYIYSTVREIVVKYEFDKKITMFVDQGVEVIKQYKIQKVVQIAINTLKSIDFQYLSEKLKENLVGALDQLKVIDFKEVIDNLNAYITTIVQQIMEFDYDAFVNMANKNIAALTKSVNEQIQAYDIPQKLEASRMFVKETRDCVMNVLKQLEETRVAEVFTTMQEMIDFTAISDIKMKLQESLDDLRQRISNMNIREEIILYLQKASEYYVNIVNYITVILNKMTEEIRKVSENQEIVNEIEQAIQLFINTLKTFQFDFPSFTVPFTDLVVPAIQINLQKLQEIQVPEKISIPEFTVLDTYRIASVTIDFEEIKEIIISFINSIRSMDISLPSPDDVFGDLRVVYLSDLPDLTFPEITLSEIKFPEIAIPKLNLENFKMDMLQIPEIKIPMIPSEVQVPAFGKLYSEFRVVCPQYNLKTEAALKNSTESQKNPKFIATLSSQAQSSVDFLEYTLSAAASIEAHTMNNMVLGENLKFEHKALNIDHQASVTLNPTSVLGEVKTEAKATTEVYTAEMRNDIRLLFQGGISASTQTAYHHNLNIQEPDISSQVSLNHKASAQLEANAISVTAETDGSGKWSILDYADDGTHKSDLQFNIDISTAKLTFTGETKSKTIKMKQSANIESAIFSYIRVNARAETETPFIKSSVLLLDGKAEVKDLTIELQGSHNTELIGRVSGDLSNSLFFLVRPFEMVFDTKNKENVKVMFPIELTGKIDLQNDYNVVLKSGVQHIEWVSLARFNQYKYHQNFIVENNEKDISVYAAMNGEANLDFLTKNLTIPALDVPYTDMKTPQITEFSLWEDFGLKKLLASTRQVFDMTFKVQYQKNPDSHSFDFDLTPIYRAINEKSKLLATKFEQGRDKAVNLLTDSYNQAKARFEKYKTDLSNLPPRSLTVPAFVIPMLNIEVSSFTEELPAFSFIFPKEFSTPSFKVMGFSIPSYTLVLPTLGLPVLHVPDTLRQLTLPTFTLPAEQNSINIPAMGNVTYDFSFKSSVITVNANGGLYNQSNIVARLETSTTSVFDVLKSRLEGTTSLTRKRGLKLATALSLVHTYVQANHESTVSLTRKNMDASLSTVAKANLPILKLDFKQELKGNTKTKPNVASKMNLEYEFSVPKYDTLGKGNIEHSLALEGLSSDLSLETSTKGKIDGTMMSNGKFAGAFENEANTYLNANGLRSTMKTTANSNVDYQKTKVWNMEMSENLALEASLRRVYATLTYSSNNQGNMAFYKTKGNHNAKVTFEYVPLTTLKSRVEIDVSQPSNTGDVSILENIDLVVTAEHQKFTWSGRERLAFVVHASDLVLSNDDSEVRLEVSESVEGSVALLKAIRLPIYQKSLWDVLKFDETTNEDKLQFLNASSTVVYTKNKEGFYFALPTKVFENGVTFSIPEITLTVPKWVKDIPQNIREFDLVDEGISFPDQITVPSFTIPAFRLPFTSLSVPSYTIDPQNIEIPKNIKVPKFHVYLPGLPKVQVPSVNIDVAYLRDKISSLAVKVPKYEITLSSITLPKSFSLGAHTIHLDEIASKISNFELPTISIPEQKIEVPEINLHLPTGVFIPYFGSLSTTVKVSSPIYNVTWAANLENKEPSFVASLKSTCTSTMLFLEYELDATATAHVKNDALSVTGKGTLNHSDLSMEWQQALTQDLRMKRQASQGTSGSRHTLNIDITSPTFTDLSVRYVCHKDSTSITLSSPSSGFLGFLLQRRNPSQVLGKLYARYPSAPEKDIDILSVRATLRDSDRLNLQTSWNAQVPYDMLSGLRERVPDITSALYKFANKHHTAHLGMDLNRASLKLKNTVSSSIEKANQEILKSLDTLQNEIEQMGERSKAVYKRAVENVQVVNLQKMSDDLSSNVRQLLKQYRKNVKVLLDAVMKFLRETKLQLPGFQEKLTAQELWISITTRVDQVIQTAADYVESYTDAFISHVKHLEFTVPGTNYVVSGREIVENVKSALRSTRDYITDMAKTLKKVKLEEVIEKLKNFLQLCLQKADELLASLKTKELEMLSAFIDDAFAVTRDALRNINARIAESKNVIAGYKQEAKERFQEVYAEMTIEHLNTNLQLWIDGVETGFRNLLDRFIQLLQEVSESVQPYMKVSNRKVDVDVPLPFRWKSFSEWPTAS
ncbi:apolipoprotein B-100 [Scleropages formosus]|uniref:Apolipoprotein B n=1 Tax=Scleropages formosus TaxID=113540 RepID=A0A8C9R491_SCLFO|nr:apolipoprotein B-100 [Scleropages formosus]